MKMSRGERLLTLVLIAIVIGSSVMLFSQLLIPTEFEAPTRAINLHSRSHDSPLSR